MRPMEQTYDVARIRALRPLILNLTNHVTMAWVANGLLSLGASPVMSCGLDDVEDLARLAQSLVVNIGTLHTDFMHLVAKIAPYAHQKPLILDPVGAGATPYRTQSALSILSTMHVSILRGNASEIMALAGEHAVTKGVDSVHDTHDAQSCALWLSKHYNTTVVVTGAIDLVVTGERIDSVSCGTPMMQQITGAGCLLSAIMGAFSVVHKDSHDAALSALWMYNKAGEVAATQSKGPGSFQVALLDVLSV